MFEKEKLKSDNKLYTKIKVECCARKSYQSPLDKTEDQELYPRQRNQSYF